MLSSVLPALESPSSLPFFKSAGAPVLTCGWRSCRTFLVEDPPSASFFLEVGALLAPGWDGRRKHGVPGFPGTVLEAPAHLIRRRTKQPQIRTLAHGSWLMASESESMGGPSQAGRGPAGIVRTTRGLAHVPAVHKRTRALLKPARDLLVTCKRRGQGPERHPRPHSITCGRL
jgi:hypothetical protein